MPLKQLWIAIESLLKGQSNDFVKSQREKKPDVVIIMLLG